MGDYQEMYNVVATKNRSEFRDYYICKVNKSNFSKLSRYIVISREHEGRMFRVISKCFVDDALGDEYVAMDQTLRSAIAISRKNDDFDGFKEKVELDILHIPIKKRISNVIASIFSFRYIILRYNRPIVADCEKNIVRTNADSLNIIGINDQDTIVMEYAAQRGKGFELKSCTVQCLLKNDMNEADIKNNSQDYNNIENHDDDLNVIQMDYDQRVILGTGDLQPIYVRRDIYGLFLKQFREFGLTFFITIIAFLFGFGEGLFNYFLYIVLAFVISIIFSIINIRSTIK